MTREIKLRIRFENEALKTCLTVALNIFERENPIAKLIEAGNKIISIEEFTGLKDKTGKEIYEGDVLQFVFKTKTKYKEGTIHYHEVIWNEVKAKWVLKRTDEKGNIHFVGLGKVDLKEHEVAGNTYENPELLGSKNAKQE